jgi:protein-glutamine gamma-glutamyltransferase
VMLRSVGIPARLVVGFAGGDATSEPGHRVLRGVDAHAWVQVWYQGIGWVDSDPTASAVLPSDETHPIKTAGLPPTAPTGQPAAQPTAQPTGQPTGQPASQPTGQRASQPTGQPASSSSPAAKQTKTVVPGGRAVWIEAMGALAILCVLLTRLGSRVLRRRRRKPTHNWRPTDGPVLQAYLRLDSSLAGASRGRAPQESLRDVGRRLADAAAFVDRHGRRAASVEEIATTLRCLERECYGIEPPTHSEAVAAVDVLDRLRRGAGSLPVTPDLAVLSVNSTR